MWCYDVVFFFKRKTAYDLRIRGVSSDVCSSDLDDRIAMTISGDGGITASVSLESLGWRLVQAFAKQLGGEVNIDNDGAIRLTQGRAPETDVRRADPVPAEQDSRL